LMPLLASRTVVGERNRVVAEKLGFYPCKPQRDLFQG
jgi:hypothetical protein